MDINAIAFSATADNLRALPVRIEHDPYCFSCDDPKSCPRKCPMIMPTESAMYPLRALRQVKEEDFKTRLKSALKAPLIQELKDEWLFLTVNAYDSITVEDFRKKIEKTLTSKIFVSGLAVIEQRGSTDETCGNGMHAHILFKRITPLSEGLPPSNIKRNFRDSFKKYCNVKNHHILNFLFVPFDSPTPDDRNNAKYKYKYMVGEKSGPEKQLKQKFDKIFREKNNLPPYFGNIDILSLK